MSMEESGFVIRRRRGRKPQDIVVSMEMWLVNNELQNRDHGLEPAQLPDAALDWDTPSTGTLSFDCVGDAHLAQVMNYLSARRASAILTPEGGRCYITAEGEADGAMNLPERVVIPVRLVDDPGPAIL